MIKIKNISKEYRLGAIGGRTLRADLQSLFAKWRGKDDPNVKIGLNKGMFGSRFLALDNVSFTVEKGERIGIIGHNGAGKSTLLKLLSRVTSPTSGTIDLEGRLSSMLEVGTGFHPELTGRENVYMNGAILGMRRSEIDKKFDDIVDFAEMRPFIETPVKRYSSGMYVKLAFSVAAHLDSEILVMDEVLAVGDMNFQQKCLDKMAKVSHEENRTILYVSHNMNTIRQLCTRCIVLEHGKLIFDGDVETAIGLYLGISGELKSEYKYDSSNHLYTDPKCGTFLEQLKLDSLTGAVCPVNGKIPMTLFFNAKVSLQNVFCRLETHYKDGSMVGTALSIVPVDISMGKSKVGMVFDVSHLAPGKYSCDLIFYNKDSLGHEHHLDGIYPAFTFEIEENLKQNNDILWNHIYWGHVRLNDVKVNLCSFV